MKKKLALIFPGIGYNIDKPLLHYARRIITEACYDVLIMPYTSQDFEDGRVTKKGVLRAYQRCQASLAEQEMEDYEEILLIGKSVGTLLAGMCSSDLTRGAQASLRFVMLTPLSQTFPYLKGQDVLALAGTKDPVITEGVLRILAQQHEVPLLLYQSGNHSLEVKGNPGQSIEILADIVRQLQAFISEGE